MVNLRVGQKVRVTYPASLYAPFQRIVVAAHNIGVIDKRQNGKQRWRVDFGDNNALWFAECELERTDDAASE